MPDSSVAQDQSLADFLAAAFPKASPRERRRLVKFKRVLINGVPAEDFDAGLRAGDAVRIQPASTEAQPKTARAGDKLRPTTVRPPAPPAAARPAPRRDRRDDRADRPANSNRFDRPRSREPHAPERPQRGDFLSGGIRIVYQDSDLIVLNKPVGIVTSSPTPTREPTVFDILKQYAKSAARPPRRSPHADRAGRGMASGVPRPWVIHRLDKDASGLLVFAKNERTFEYLKEELRAKRMHRLYLALAEGIIGEKDSAGTIQSFLKEDPSGKVASISPEQFRGRPPRPPRGEDEGDGGDMAKLAVTHYRVLAAANGLSLVQVRLETGRKNQIRVHFSERGHPLVGDRRHGASQNPIERLGLHAAELGFSHPATGKPMRFTSPPPGSFYRAVGLPPPATAEPEPLAPPPRDLPAARERPLPETSWDDVADWYDTLLDDRGSDHYEQVILPGALRLLAPAEGQRVLDVACGQGILSRRLAALGVHVIGVEASPRLVDAARERTGATPSPHAPVEYHVVDARDLAPLNLRDFDAAACIMAVTNIDPLEPVFRGVSAALRPGGRFVLVLAHPAFRAAGQTSWGWDEASKRQYRRVDGYLSPGQSTIEMHPGRKARGQSGGDATTITFHRPLQAYAKALADTGFLVDAIEEWPGLRISTSGPRAAEENRIRREIPLFLAIRAVRA